MALELRAGRVDGNSGLPKTGALLSIGMLLPENRATVGLAEDCFR